MYKTTVCALDNQIANIVILRIMGILMAVMLSLGAGVVGFKQFQPLDPYVQSVLSLTGDRTQGHAIFQMNCAGCHGWEAHGKVGPTLQGVSERKSRRQLIVQVTSGKTPPMPQFQPTAEEMADLLSYLEQL